MLLIITLLLCLYDANSFHFSRHRNFIRPVKLASYELDRGQDEQQTITAARGLAIKIPSDKKLNIGIIGCGISGMVTALELADAGHQVHIFESRKFPGGKVGSWMDKDGNHIEMGLHVFFGCYYNLFGIMKRVGAFDNLLLKEHTTKFINENGIINELDFRMKNDKIGAPWSGISAFVNTNQINLIDKVTNAIALSTSPILTALYSFQKGLEQTRSLDSVTFSQWLLSKGGTRHSIERLWDPIAYALGFLNCDEISARCMLTIFQYFATRTTASVLRMLKGSPYEFLHTPLLAYLKARNVTIELNTRIERLLYSEDPTTGKPTQVQGLVVLADSTLPGVPETSSSQKTREERSFDVIVAATDAPGIQKLLPPAFITSEPFFEKITRLETVPVQTVQLRFNGWVTELSNPTRAQDVNTLYYHPNKTSHPDTISTNHPPGLDNLLYSPDAPFSCFADLAVTSPASYYKPNEGSLLQFVLTPGDRWMNQTAEHIVQETLAAVYRLFPSAKGLTCTWWNVVKLGKSLYREGAGVDKNRPSQVTPIQNFFLAGSYTFQDYLDSMEGATKAGLQCAKEIIDRTDALQSCKGIPIR